MKVIELKQILSGLDEDLEVVVHSGGEDGFGYSPVANVEVRKAIFHGDGYDLDGPYELDDQGDREVVAIQTI